MYGEGRNLFINHRFLLRRSRMDHGRDMDFSTFGVLQAGWDYDVDVGIEKKFI